MRGADTGKYGKTLARQHQADRSAWRSGHRPDNGLSCRSVDGFIRFAQICDPSSEPGFASNRGQGRLRLLPRTALEATLPVNTLYIGNLTCVQQFAAGVAAECCRSTHQDFNHG